MRDLRLLAFDTSGPHCAVALYGSGAILGEQVQPMARGQAEALMPLLEEALAAQSLEWRDLDAISVGIGPGNFTGIRISVSAARGLALALGIPAIGVSMFEVMAEGLPAQETALVSLPAPRGMVYLQAMRNGAPLGKADVAVPETLPADFLAGGATVAVGERAEELARAIGCGAVEATLEDIPSSIARIAVRKALSAKDPLPRPAPLYVRPADAAPPSDPPPVIVP